MKKNRTQWLHLLAFLPIVILLPVINYIVDPGEVFHNSSQAMAKYWLQGNDVAFAYNNGDDRQFKKLAMMGLPEHTNCIIAGPSLTTAIQDGTVGGTAFNLSVNGASFYDIFGQLGLLNILGKKYDRLVLGLDGQFFSDAIHGEMEGYRFDEAWIPYAHYLMDILDGKDPQKPVDERNELDLLQRKIETAFSVSYFQSSVYTMRTQENWWETAFRDEKDCIVDASYEGSYFRHEDCSMVYAKVSQQGTAENVRADAAKYSIDALGRQKHISEYSAAYLDKLIAWLLDNGIKVELWICPLAPSLWDRLDLDEFPYLTEIESCAQDLAAKYPEIEVLGSYDPYRLGITDADFYDSRHMRFESLDRYFDFTWH